MSVPSRAMLLREPKVMLPKARSRRQSLQGAPISKNRRPRGLMRIYLQPKRACYDITAGMGWRRPQPAPEAVLEGCPPVQERAIRSSCKIGQFMVACWYDA